MSFVDRASTPLTTQFYHCTPQYGPDRYRADTLHYAAAEGNVEAVHELLAKGVNVYRTVRDGETALHVAIANGQREIYDALVGVYERDFGVVERSLREKYGWSGDRFWLKERIAVATTEEQCERAVGLGDSAGLAKLEEFEVRMVLLKIVGETPRVVVLGVGDANRKSVDSLLGYLSPNGFLTWGSSEVNGKCWSLLELAASCGDVQLVRRLIASGADPAQRGSAMNTPLMEACRKNNMTMIKLFFEDYGDQLDPTATNRVGESALTFVLQYGDAESFGYVLNKVIAYRKCNYHESDSEAFNNCFRYDNPSWPEVSIWSMVGDHLKTADLVPYLERELYGSRGEQCRMLFENEKGAVITVASVLSHENNDVLRFLFEHHLEYIRSIADMVMDSFFEEDLLPEKLFDEPLHIWVEHLPEMESRVTELEDKVAERELEMMQEDWNFNQQFM
ncbi:hypothetical protein pipiens_010906 [Culex pipiens pipiens]|uniref:Uncharacterized protein n=1 Tax=Culex pipiens pipiens TaxID=38569 RepID=A0ABD1D958_CULPP